MNDPVKAKLVELVPEILELKFGCELLYKGLHYYYVREHALAGHWCLRGFNQTITGDEYFKFFESAFLEILGRPITLADILRAIRKAPNGIARCVGLDGDFLRVYPSVGDSFEWNLLEHYDNQTQEVKDFIGRLLSVTSNS